MKKSKFETINTVKSACVKNESKTNKVQSSGKQLKPKHVGGGGAGMGK